MKKIISLLLTLALILSILCSCEIDNRFVEVTDKENDNEDITGWDDIDDDNISDWDDVIVSTWSDVDDLSQWVRSQILFDDITDEYASVECVVLDYQSNGKYFDGEKVYELVGNKFDLNPLIAKFAIGTGVIVICVVVNVVTAGTTTPVACFFAGAAQAAISEAIKGAAFGAAMGAVSAAIKSEGELDSTFYGTLEGASEGYMWGAVFGAISGGLTSKVCFTGNTKVLTLHGYKRIDAIEVGEYVYSYDEATNSCAWQEVLNTFKNTASTIVKIKTAADTIECTYEHPFLTTKGWKIAGELDENDVLISDNNFGVPIVKIEVENYDTPLDVFNLNVESYHTYLVGSEKLVVHNVCANDYKNKTYYFDEGTAQAKKYPNGIKVDSKGYPRFEEYAINTVKFDFPSQSGLTNGTCLSGEYLPDTKLANAICGYKSTPTGYVWHHVEDMQTMVLVPQDLHSFMKGGLRHNGGASLIRQLIKTFG